MKALKHSSRLRLVALAALLAWAAPSLAQTFNSGSTGADGAFSPSSNTVVQLPPDGVLNYTTVTIPAGVTVSFQRNQSNTPVTMLATGDVTINGALSLNGGSGAGGSNPATLRPAGGAGGPGGFRGGDAGMSGIAHQSGQGPGGASGSCSSGTYGASATFVSVLPLFGGSGGSGNGPNFNAGAGSAGGGGGGAIVIASSTRVVVAGAISANGGLGGTSNGPAGSGSGGAIRLVAPLVQGAGSLTAAGVTNGSCGTGGNGRIRIEAFSNTYSGGLTPVVGQGTTLSSTVGPVTPAGNPALVALPTITVASVGGAATPAAPGGSFTQADVTVPQGTANPVPVVIAAANTPLSASVRVVMVPQIGASVTSAPLTLSGTFASSSVTANVTLPVGSVSVLQAWATMTLTGQIASLFPSIDGDPADSVRVASSGSGPATLSLVTRSGKERRYEELAREDQIRVALAWDAMREAR